MTARNHSREQLSHHVGVSSPFSSWYRPHRLSAGPATLQIAPVALHTVRVIRDYLGFFTNIAGGVQRIRYLHHEHHGPTSRGYGRSTSLTFTFPLHSHCDRLLALDVLHIGDSLPLAIFAFISAAQNLSLKVEPLVPYLRYISPGRHSKSYGVAINNVFINPFKPRGRRTASLTCRLVQQWNYYRIRASQ